MIIFANKSTKLVWIPTFALAGIIFGQWLSAQNLSFQTVWYCILWRWFDFAHHPERLKGVEGMRIIAGTKRGMKLFSPPTCESRPITDCVKKSLFNVIRKYGLPAVQINNLL
jgi:hypothetical protein